MKYRYIVAFAAAIWWLPPVNAQNANAFPAVGENLAIELTWQTPVDLDLFLTGPSGETIYFGNRIARAGYRMDGETTCGTLDQSNGPHSETAIIEATAAGLYRISVDYIFDCGSGLDETGAIVSLSSITTGQKLGSNVFTVRQQKLKTVAWEFEVLQK